MEELQRRADPAVTTCASDALTSRDRAEAFRAHLAIEGLIAI
jgi:hypothetical protein